MSDFGELCPLFETGVFKEVTFPEVSMTDISVSVNALLGTITAAHSGRFTFGRTVVVTDAFVKRREISEKLTLHLLHHSSELADPSVIGSLGMSTTSLAYDVLTWSPMNVTNKTFTSTDVLGFSVATGTAVSAGVYDLIVRYKEK